MSFNHALGGKNNKSTAIRMQRTENRSFFMLNEKKSTLAFMLFYSIRLFYSLCLHILIKLLHQFFSIIFFLFHFISVLTIFVLLGAAAVFVVFVVVAGSSGGKRMQLFKLIQIASRHR